MPASSRLTPSRIALGSILVALVVLGLKYLAYAMTNSVGLYSDALESLVNLAAAIAVVVAVRVGDMPPDRNHPYGHHKAEYISAVVEGVLIVFAAFAIFREAIPTFTHPRNLDVPIEGLLLNGLAGALNGAWAWLLIAQGRKLRSAAIEADGKHLLTDLFSSIGVLAGVTIALATGLDWLDPLLAILVGISILWTGWGLISTSVGGLMDEALSDEDVALVQTLITDHAQGAIEAHDLRTRRSGKASFIEFHLVVPSEMQVYDAHEICDRIENALQDTVPGSIVTIHLEPANKALHENHDGCMVI